MPARINIDFEKLKQFLRLKPTLKDTAAFFDCTERTVERRIKEETGLTFPQLRDKQMTHTRHALIQKAISEALNKNNVMLIFCLKNLCGWSDKQEVQEQSTQTIKLAYSVDGEGE